MEPGVLIVLLLVVLLVIGVNGFLVLTIRRNSPNNRYARWRKSLPLWRKAIRTAQNPWERENEDLEELSRLVDSLKESDK